MRSMMTLVVLSLTLAAGGCATLTKGTSQTVTINTDPAGANCTLTRDGKTVAVVNPTPGSIPVGKAQATVFLACAKQGYLEASGQLASEFQPMTFGNILLGGIVGVIVDAASGAMHRYPDMVTITLIPESFETPAARDKFFDQMRETLEREVTEVKERIARLCNPGNCDQQREAADAETAQKRAEIERLRAQARVAANRQEE